MVGLGEIIVTGERVPTGGGYKGMFAVGVPTDGARIVVRSRGYAANAGTRHVFDKTCTHTYYATYPRS